MKFRFVSGEGNKYSELARWVSVDLEDNDSMERIGAALVVLWQHGATKNVWLLTEDEWFDHVASLKEYNGVSHFDLGLEVTH